MTLLAVRAHGPPPVRLIASVSGPSLNEGPWLTIVTVVRNDAAGLTDTARSIARQRVDPGVEHLVVDGASTDDTRTVLKRLSSVAGVRVVSEPDGGIYDAMNKGWRGARGFWIQYLNAGDVYASDTELAWVRARLAAHPAEWLRTRVRFVNSAGQQTRPVGSSRIDANFWWGWQTTLHQGAFMSRDLLQRLGGFDDRTRVQGDFDLMLRAVRSGCRPWVEDRVTVDVDASGVSTQLWRVGFGEMHRARCRGRGRLVSMASSLDHGVHLGVVAGRRSARRGLEWALGPERVSQLRR